MKYKLLSLSLLSLLSLLSFSSCGDDEGGMVASKEAHTYKVVLEASGEDYTAEAQVLNTENVSIFDETKGVDLKQWTVTEKFVGKKIYRTTDNVRFFSAYGIILSDTGATLKMTVYEDDEEVYTNTVSVPDGVENSKQLIFSRNNMVE